jgi:hypothetical protein
MASTSKSHKKPIVQKPKSTSSSSYKNVNPEGELNWKNDTNVNSIVYKPRPPTSEKYKLNHNPESEINWDPNQGRSVENISNYNPRDPPSEKYKLNHNPESEINWNPNDKGSTYFGGKKSRKSHNSKKSHKSKKSHTTYKKSKMSRR